MEKYKTIHENDARLFPKVETRTSIIAEFKNKILELDKYDTTEFGEVVILEDILNLF